MFSLNASHQAWLREQRKQAGMQRKAAEVIAALQEAPKSLDVDDATLAAAATKLQCTAPSLKALAKERHENRLGALHQPWWWQLEQSMKN